jgi:hypothetical protein
MMRSCVFHKWAKHYLHAQPGNLLLLFLSRYEVVKCFGISVFLFTILTIIICQRFPEMYFVTYVQMISLINQGFLVAKLKSSLRKLYGRHHDLVNHRICNKSNTTGATCGAETAYPSGLWISGTQVSSNNRWIYWLTTSKKIWRYQLDNRKP